MEKIHHRVAPRQEAVGEVAGDAAEDKSERDLAGDGVGIEMMPREKQRDKRQQSDEGQCAVVAAKQTPRRAGVAPVDEFEKAADDDFFVAFFEQVQHEPFRELVEDEHDRRDDSDVAIRLLENGIGSSHVNKFATLNRKPWQS